MSAGFQCKQFFIAHDRCAMKVGTDGFLLGAWAPLFINNTATTANTRATTSKILDIGTGTGLISLMLAQRTQGLIPISAIEFDATAAEQAKENIASSPWPNSIQVITADILAYQPTERYRLIVSNPPFFQQSMAAKQAARHLARHADQLPFNRLLEKAAALLDTNGIFALILPYNGIEHFIALAKSLGWQLQQHCVVFSKTEKPQRSLIVLVKAKGSLLAKHSQLLIHNPDGSYTTQYQQLLAEFYLKFPSSAARYPSAADTAKAAE